MTDPASLPVTASSSDFADLAAWAEALCSVSDRRASGAVRAFLRGVAQAALEGPAYQVPVPRAACESRRFAWFGGRIELLLDGLASGMILDVEPVAEDGWESALARVVVRAATGVELTLPEPAGGRSGGWCVQWRSVRGSGEFQGPAGMESGWTDFGPSREARGLVVRATSGGVVIEWPLAPAEGAMVGAASWEGSRASDVGADGVNMETALKAALEVWGRAGERGRMELEGVRELNLQSESGHRWCAWPLAEGAQPVREMAGRRMLELACLGARAVAWVGAGVSPGGVPSVGPARLDASGDRMSADRAELWGVREVGAEGSPAREYREGDALVLLGQPGVSTSLPVAGCEPGRLLETTVRGLVLAGVLRSASVGAREGLGRTLLDAGNGLGWVLDFRDPEWARESGKPGYWSEDASVCVLASCAVEDAGGVVARARLLGVPAWRLGLAGGAELRWVTDAGERAIPWPAAAERGAPPATATGA